MKFSPLLVSALMIEPLRYFFSEPGIPDGFRYNEDSKKSQIEIGNVNDFHKVKIQAKPRILISRGTYQVGKTGLTDNMAEAKGVREIFGANNRNNMVWINGQAQIIVEATQEGTCEMLADMVSHFIVWSRPLLCDTQGFKEFGLNMMVSECTPDREDLEKFKAVISIPYMTEEHWNVQWDHVKIRSIYSKITQQSGGATAERVVTK